MVNELAQKVINKKPYLETRIVTYVNNDGKTEMYYTNFPLSNGKYKCKENLDRIKLPCYCTFEWRGKRRLGMITNSYKREAGYHKDQRACRLFEVDKQTSRKVGSIIDVDWIKDLINNYKINIGKVKLTYYETI
jgi:hypothetical protein